MTRRSKWVSSIVVFAAATAITAVSGAGSSADRDTREREEGRMVRAANGPGPGPNGPGPGSNVIPPLASTGTKVNISEFPPADSLTDPELAGPVQLLRSGTSPLPNHGEAQAAESRNDFVHKLSICLKELRESRRWLRLAGRVPLIKPPTEFDPLLDETESLIKIFATSIRTAQRNADESSTTSNRPLSHARRAIDAQKRPIQLLCPTLAFLKSNAARKCSRWIH